MTNNNNNSEVTLSQRLLWLCNLFYYLLVAILASLLLWVFFDNNNVNSPMLWHMVLCSVSYVPLMGIAIIAFSKDNLPTLYMTRKRIYWVHGILLTLACLSVSIGICLEINSKIKGGRAHFASTHSILGLTSWILVSCAVSLGILAANNGFKNYVRPAIVKFLHNLFGIAAFVLGVAAIIVMFKSHHYKNFISDSVYRASYVVAIYIIFWSLLSALKSLYSQAKGLVC